MKQGQGAAAAPIEQLRFRILSPPEIRARGGALALGSAKQRTLLAMLLLHANRIVPAERLIDAIWDERPPATVATQLQAQVSSLRGVLARGGVGRPIVTRSPGYLLRVEPGQLDLEVFERLHSRARQALAEGRPAEAAADYEAALALWRGPALGGVGGRYLRAEAERLEELRLAVLEGRVEAALALGRHTAVVAELRALVASHPLRERLRAQLMIALYRNGRQAEALAAYREGRTTLVDELGLEPGMELRRLEQSILTADPALALVGDGPGAAGPAEHLAAALERAGAALEIAGARLQALARALVAAS